jgi:enamine deaminase RidA (YjgF/YER057c/UK114 family)
MAEYVNPSELATPRGYTHVVTAEGRLVFVAGQVAFEDDGSVHGVGDFPAQAQQAYANLATALAAVGATLRDVVRLTTYVVDYRVEYRDILREIRAQHWPENPPAATLLGVSALALPELLIEVEATAVINPRG